jgi:hypothetical protein
MTALPKIEQIETGSKKILRMARRIQCSACGATLDAACNCGAPYISPGMRAREAVAKNPEKSDRAIASAIGVSTPTVGQARAGVKNFTSAKRIGRDGKKYPAKKSKPKTVNPSKAINAFHKDAVGFLATFDQRFNTWLESAPIISADGKAALMQALYLCADGFARLAQKLDGR